MSKKEQDTAATPHPDGFREGVMNDPTGVQYGIEMDNDATINPADIKALKDIDLEKPNKDSNKPL